MAILYPPLKETRGGGISLPACGLLDGSSGRWSPGAVVGSVVFFLDEAALDSPLEFVESCLLCTLTPFSPAPSLQETVALYMALFH